MKLKFKPEDDFSKIWHVYEDGIDTEKVKFESLGLIFEDELGFHWNIAEEYSGIIELNELKQITSFMEENESQTENKNG